MKSCYNCRYYREEYLGEAEYKCECSKHNFDITGYSMNFSQIENAVSQYVCDDYKTDSLAELFKTINFREVK